MIIEGKSEERRNNGKVPGIEGVIIKKINNKKNVPTRGAPPIISSQA